MYLYILIFCIGPAALRVCFVKPVVFTVRDKRYPGGVAKILAEPELAGKFTKWNNNAGGVGGGEGSKEARLCQLCMERPREVRFNCGHAVLCRGCLTNFLAQAHILKSAAYGAFL